MLLFLQLLPRRLKGSVEFPAVVGPPLLRRGTKTALLFALLFHHIWWEGQVVGDSMGARREQMNSKQKQSGGEGEEEGGPLLACTIEDSPVLKLPAQPPGRTASPIPT